MGQPLEAIILAGGFGTRLAKVLPDIPKPMAPVGGRPFLEICLDMLAVKGFQHVILSLGYKAEIIQRHFGIRYRGIEIDYHIEDFPLGTGGATKAAMNLARNNEVFVLNGDTFIDLDFGAMYREHSATNVKVSITAVRVEDTYRYGRLAVSGGIITGFLEKGASGPGFINSGVYLLDHNLFNNFELAPQFAIESDFFVPHLSYLSPHAYVSQGYFIDIGIPEDWDRAQTELANINCKSPHIFQPFSADRVQVTGANPELPVK